jgi:peptidoglycan/LPS O-acetylase OafA/YrhL
MPIPEITTRARAAAYPLDYNPAFDGLRAVAVIVVMLLHARVPGFGSGEFGVDVFFVLSGYLITSMLVHGIAQRQPLGIIYWHRFIRLTPPLIVVCASLLAVAPLLGMSLQAVNDSAASLLYVSDWTVTYHVEGIPSFLNNTWSLAIEEQFYLIWPLSLLGMRRIGGMRAVLPATLCLLAISLAWQFWMWWMIDPGRVYFAFDTRCCGLLIGCATALAGEHLAHARRFLRPAGRVGATFLGGLMAGGAGWTPWTCLGASVASAAVIADLAVNRSGPIHSVLCQRGPVAIGRISYAVYLWHMPVTLIVEHHLALPKVIGTLLSISITLICATASFFIIEQPARHLRDVLSRLWAARAGRSAAAVSLVGMVAGVGIFWRADIANLVNPQSLEIVAYGPLSLHRGETFNLQPDGSSVMWIKTSRSVPLSARIKIGQDILETSARSTLTTAALPQAIRDRVGVVPISIVNAKGDLLAGPVSFEISP